MKRNAIVRIIVYTVLALVLLGMLYAGLEMDTFFDDEDSLESKTRKVTFDPSKVTSLSVDWMLGDVKIKTSDVKQITVVEEGAFPDYQNMVCKLDDGELSIRYAKVTFSSSMCSKDLTILVPNTWTCQELELDCASVNVNITGLTIDHVQLNSALLELDYNGFFNTMECDGAKCTLRITTTGKPDRLDIEGADCDVNISLINECGFLVTSDGINNIYTMRGGQDANGNYAYLDGHFKICIEGIGCTLRVH